MASHDYEEFIAALNAHGVRYLVVGAHAVAFHARPRATKDLDILIEPTAANAGKVLAALKDFFGGADLGYTVDDLTAPDWIIQLGVAPVRIDLLAEILGFSKFEDAWKNRVEAHFGSVPTHYIGLNDLIHAKQSAGRLQDRADVRVLRRMKSSTPRTRRAGRRRRPRR
ncbi:MAG TPA: nucleotidyltransferase [Candidatus Binatia bacterium]|jgi:predicted nucleotidyltransferase|nr:nucleotidyltransferase [Candidatus Binatia bacterium]